MRQYKIAISFHDDLDGLMSCVVLLDYLINKTPINIEDFNEDIYLRPVGHPEKETWYEEGIPDANIKAVVDFTVHPELIIEDENNYIFYHFDHHSSAEDNFKEYINGSTVLIDGDYPSCAGLIYKHLDKKYGYRNPRFEDAMLFTNIIDSASFNTPSDVFNFDCGYLRLYHAIYNCETRREFLQYLCQRFIEDRDNSIEDIIDQDPQIISEVENSKRKIEEGFVLVKERKKLIEKNGYIFSLWYNKMSERNVVDSFMLIKSFPKIDICLFVNELGGGIVNFSASKNPFKEQNEKVKKLHLGNFMNSLDPNGGGHQAASGCNIERAKLGEAVNKLIAKLK